MDKKKELEAFRWFVRVSEDWPPLNTDDERRRFQREVLLFLTKNGRPVGLPFNIPCQFIPGESENTDAKSWRDWTEFLQEQIIGVINDAATRKSVKLPWPQWRQLSWNKAQDRLMMSRYSTR